MGELGEDLLDGDRFSGGSRTIAPSVFDFPVISGIRFKLDDFEAVQRKVISYGNKGRRRTMYSLVPGCEPPLSESGPAWV